MTLSTHFSVLPANHTTSRLFASASLCHCFSIPPPPSFSLVPSLSLSAAGVPTNTLLNVATPKFFTKLGSTLAGKLPMLRAYLWHLVLAGFSPMLSEAFRNEHFDFFGKTLNGLVRVWVYATHSQ